MGNFKKWFVRSVELGTIVVREPNNGNFLGILELISHYFTTAFRKSKKISTTASRLLVYYLLAEIQNEFISLCADQIMSVILNE